MTDRDDFIELVADVRALVEDLRARGIAELPLEASAPSPAAAELVPSAPAARRAQTIAPPLPMREVPPPAVATSAWANMAAASREASDDAAVHGAEGLQRIRDDLGDCRRCNLCKDRRNIVFGVGDPGAALMVIGEGPGHDEDLQGDPFVGAAGQMLDKMLLNVVGFAREQVYIANIVKCRPPGNRNPLPDEIAACRPYLERQILAVRPKVLLVLGSVALKSLLDTTSGIMKMRGAWTEWRGIPVMPTFHPAYLLRNPDDKRKTFEDLKALKARFDEFQAR